MARCAGEGAGYDVVCYRRTLASLMDTTLDPANDNWFSAHTYDVTQQLEVDAPSTAPLRLPARTQPSPIPPPARIHVPRLALPHPGPRSVTALTHTCRHTCTKTN